MTFDRGDILNFFESYNTDDAIRLQTNKRFGYH